MRLYCMKNRIKCQEKWKKPRQKLRYRSFCRGSFARCGILSVFVLICLIYFVVGSKIRREIFFSRFRLPDKVSPDLLLRLRCRETGLPSGFQRLEHPGHVPSEGAHDHHAFSVLLDFLRCVAKDDIPVSGRDERHIADGKIFVELVEGGDGTSPAAAGHSGARLVGKSAAGIKHPVEERGDTASGSGIMNGEPTIMASQCSILAMATLTASSPKIHLPSLFLRHIPQPIQPRIGSRPIWSHSVSISSICKVFSTSKSARQVHPFGCGLPLSSNTFMFFILSGCENK